LPTGALVNFYVRYLRNALSGRVWKDNCGVKSMKPLFFNLDKTLALMVIPDTEAHLDGHAILTYTYSIFRDRDNGNPLQSLSKESKLHLKRTNDPDYYGYITFENPGQLFTYTSGEQNELTSEQVMELIEEISEVRNNPSLWRHLED
jgi:hypothetical protein